MASLSRPAPASGGGHGILPEWYLILAWAGSLAGFMIWLQDELTAQDLVVFAVVYLLCLPLISRRTTPGLLAWIGGPICGLISGMQLIDLVFDLCIIRDVSISDGVSVFEGRRVAFLYYRTVLTSCHVNTALLGIIVVSFLGSFIGLGRSSPRVRKQWLTLGACMFVGTGGYLFSVVTRYTHIRTAAVYDASLFDSWHMVLVARMQLYASLLVSLPFLFKMSTMPSDEQEWAELASKVHEQ